jgi:phosphoglycerol transferase MdoB-like AlkP superfamily enzyme
MKNIKFIYLCFLSGVLFLIVSGAFYSTEHNNLTPVFASIGFAIISISFALLSRAKSCKSKNNK